jgi:hypothetical protein
MGDCVCIWGGEGDAPDFLNEQELVARKQHKCRECGVVIATGQQYLRTSGKWDGRMDTIKTCQPCAEIRRKLLCDGWVYGELWERIHESWDEGVNPMGCINELVSVVAKEKLSLEYRDWLADR